MKISDEAFFNFDFEKNVWILDYGIMKVWQ